MRASNFLQSLDHQRITAAIAEAEGRTSGQIRVVVSRRQVDDAFAAARQRFVKLGMEKTAERNGVLIYFSPLARKYAIVGDSGIHARCGGDDYWQTVVGSIMRPLLQENRFTEAIVAAVGEIGQQLGKHFPHRPDGKNELSDEVILE